MVQGAVLRQRAQRLTEARCRSVEAGDAAREDISNQADQSAVVSDFIILTFLVPIEMASRSPRGKRIRLPLVSWRYKHLL